MLSSTGCDFPADADPMAEDRRGAVFLGCKFGGVDESGLVGRGALVFPAFRDLAYDPYRASLYTPAELFTSRSKGNGRNLGSANLRRFRQAREVRPERGGRSCPESSRPGHRSGVGSTWTLTDPARLAATSSRSWAAIAPVETIPASDRSPCWHGRWRGQGYLISTGGGPE